MKVTIKETGKVSFKQRIAETRAMYEKMLVRDLANVASEIHANIQLNGFDDTFKKIYQKEFPYKPFRGADKPNKKGQLVFIQKKVVSRSGDAKKAFSPMKFVEHRNLIVASNESNDFDMQVTGKKAVISISGRSGAKLKRRLMIIRTGIKATKKDWSQMTKAIKSNMREHVNLLNKMQQARKAKRVN